MPLFAIWDLISLLCLINETSSSPAGTTGVKSVAPGDFDLLLVSFTGV
jgi:hypothetical protein